MAKGTLCNKVFDSHVVADLPTGEKQVVIDDMQGHEVTTAPAFDELKKEGHSVLFPNRIFMTYDHVVPTDSRQRPFYATLDERLIATLEQNCREHGITLFDFKSGRQGIVHVIGLELGLTQPGDIIVCGDSHTSTHGALGALAFGIGTTDAKYVMATQSLNMVEPKVRQILVDGEFRNGVYPKDLILRVIHDLGVAGGKGFAYEYAGSTIKNMSIDGRATVCNMSIEGGALVGYVNPDQTTFDYLKGRDFVPRGAEFDERVKELIAVRTD